MCLVLLLLLLFWNNILVRPVKICLSGICCRRKFIIIVLDTPCFIMITNNIAYLRCVFKAYVRSQFVRINIFIWLCREIIAALPIRKNNAVGGSEIGGWIIIYIIISGIWHSWSWRCCIGDCIFGIDLYRFFFFHMI